jgi:hypothetical protein
MPYHSDAKRDSNFPTFTHPRIDDHAKLLFTVKPAPVYLFRLAEKIAHLFLHSDILTRLYWRTLSKGEVAIAATTIGFLHAHLITSELPNHPSKSRGPSLA